MAKNKNLGPIVAQIGGYRIRQILASREINTVDRFGKAIRTSSISHNGTFGIYAGKNLAKDGFKSLDAAKEMAASW